MVTNHKPKFLAALMKEKIHHEIICEQVVIYSKISDSQNG